MNYNDWVDTFKNRTPEHLRGIVNAIDTLEKDPDIRRDFDDLGIFAGFCIRGAAKEALKKKEEQFIRVVAQRVYETVIARIVEEYPQVDPAVITCPVTFQKLLEWIPEIVVDTECHILDAAGTIIDIVIDDVHLYYPDLISKFIEEAEVDQGADESECSVLNGESYYTLEDDIVNILLSTNEQGSLDMVGEEEVIRTSYFWGGCDCGDEVVHPKGLQTCPKCGMMAASRPDARVDDVVNAKLRGEI